MQVAVEKFKRALGATVVVASGAMIASGEVVETALFIGFIGLGALLFVSGQER